jgi:site-specific DNA-methyltransferase (adenine-specific)
MCQKGRDDMTFKISPNSIWNLDCIQGMQNIRKKSVDLIVTDPPFGIGFKAKKANYNRKQSLVIDGYHEIKVDHYLKFTLDWLEQAKRILKDSGSMYIFSGYNNLKDILIALDHHSLGYQQLIWKYQFGVYTQRKFVTSHYNILHVWKDAKKKKFYPDWRYTKKDRTPDGGSKQYRDMESVWDIKREYWTGEEKTPNKLPYGLVLKCLGYSSKRGDTVCDPFLGSGQVALVARETGRKYIGFEISKNYYEFAKRQLAPKVITA